MKIKEISYDKKRHNLWKNINRNKLYNLLGLCYFLSYLGSMFWWFGILQFLDLHTWCLSKKTNKDKVYKPMGGSPTINVMV